MSTTEIAPMAANGPPQRTAVTVPAAILEKVVAEGDLSLLSPAERVQWYLARCDAAKVDPRTQPFQYITLNGKLTLYATKVCSDQLIEKRNLSAEIVDSRFVPELNIYQVQCRVKRPDGSVVDDIAAVNTKGLYGDQLCNALMKCTTKAKRRAVLSACGLGMSDESEVDTIPGAVIEGTFSGLTPSPQSPPKRAELPPPAAKPQNNSGHATGQYASPEQTDAYKRECRLYVSMRNARWLDYWQMQDIEAHDLVNTMQLTRHLLKWGLREGKLAPVGITWNPETGEQTEKVSTEQAVRYVAILNARTEKTSDDQTQPDHDALWAEAEAYVDALAQRESAKLDPSETDAADEPHDRQPGEEG